VQIKDIASLRAEIDALKARQKAVEDLQTDRNTPVRLLDELVKQTPEGVYITAIRQTGTRCWSTALRRPTNGCPNCCATCSTTRPGWSSPTWSRSGR
jgi:Tfp pilus assembly protein PilN